jgi:hypothetical protein
LGPSGGVLETFDTVWIPSAVEGELRGVPDRAVLESIEQAEPAAWLNARPALNTNLVSSKASSSIG